MFIDLTHATPSALTLLKCIDVHLIHEGSLSIDLRQVNGAIIVVHLEGHLLNESTVGADASVEALKLYHMKLTLAYSIAYLLCQH